MREGARLLIQQAIEAELASFLEAFQNCKLADGIYSGLRAEDAKLCALVVIGVNERGKKRFLAIEDGVRESTQSWREERLDLKGRGMNAPKLAVGDGAMDFWAALEEV